MTNKALKKIDLELRTIMIQYQQSFTEKTYNSENNENDILMDIFDITPELKRENRQYWGRELGMCWQLLINKLCQINCSNYKPALKIKGDEPTDLFIGNDAIDTKYRIGSGDSGTLKKFKTYGKLLKKQGYNPVILILRDDNLPAAITACKVGGWKIYAGKDCFKYIQEKTKFDIEKYLLSLKKKFSVSRKD